MAKWTTCSMKQTSLIVALRSPHMSGTHRACFRDHATFWNKIKPSLAPRFNQSPSDQFPAVWCRLVFTRCLTMASFIYIHSALWFVMWFSCIVRHCAFINSWVKSIWLFTHIQPLFQLGCHSQITTINLWSSHAPPASSISCFTPSVERSNVLSA